MSLHSLRQRRRRPVGFTPRVESLEDRCVPTCTAIQFGSTLNVTGTVRADTIQIGDDGVGEISLLCDGDQTPRLFNGIVQVNVRTLAGKDLVHYDLLGSVSSLHGLSVNFGGGNDRFLAFLNGKTLLSGADYRINVQGGRGNDNYAVNVGLDPNTQLVARLSQGLVIPPFVPFLPGGLSGGTTPVVDIAQNAIFRLNLAGGRGNDTINVNYEGIIAGNAGGPANPFVPASNPGTLQVSIRGGKGKDVFVTHILADATSAGRVRATEQGGPRNDNLTLTVYQQPTPGTSQGQVVNVSARIDGGPGINHCTRTPNVAAVNCRFDTLEPVFLPNGEFAPPFLPPGITPPFGVSL
jgi:hypothetical protein